MFNVKEIEKIEVEYGVRLDDLSRRAIVELVNRYEDYISNSDKDGIMSINDFLYENPDLVNELKPDYDRILNAVCCMIDYVDDILDSHDITVPDNFRDELGEDDDIQPSRIYGETYYDIEDYFMSTVYRLLEQEEDRYEDE